MRRRKSERAELARLTEVVARLESELAGAVAAAAGVIHAWPAQLRGDALCLGGRAGGRGARFHKMHFFAQIPRNLAKFHEFHGI